MAFVHRLRPATSRLMNIQPASCTRKPHNRAFASLSRARSASQSVARLLSQRHPHAPAALTCGFLMPSRAFHGHVTRHSQAEDMAGSANETLSETFGSVSDIGSGLAEAIAELGDAATHIIVQKGDVVAAGLGCWYTPVGILQRVLEAGCVDLGLPWWGSIALVTAAMRLALLPLVGSTMRNNITFQNLKPQIDAIVEEMKKYTNKGDKLGAAKEYERLRAFLKSHDCSQGRIFLMPAVQLPTFLSFFLAIRKMADLPIESMKTGGLWWFTDLTQADPYYILPTVSAISLLATIELGSDGISNQNQPPQMKQFMRFFALTIIPLGGSFPAGVLVYWVTANALSLSQLMFFRIPGVKKYYKIPDMKKHAVTKPAPSFMDAFNAAFAANSVQETPHDSSHGKGNAREDSSKRSVSHSIGKSKMMKKGRR